MWFSNPTHGHIFRKDGKPNSKRYMHPNVHSNTIHNGQDIEATKMSINRWVDKDVVLYISISIYTVEYYSDIKNNASWSNMDASRDYHTKGNKTEKDKCHISLTCEIWNIRYKLTYLQNRKRLIDIENKFMVIKGEKVGGRMNSEFKINRYIWLCIK